MKIKRICLFCKAIFIRQISPSGLNKGGGKYCSNKCTGNALSHRYKNGEWNIYLKGLQKGWGIRKGIKLGKQTREKISKSLLGKCGKLSRNWQGGLTVINFGIRYSNEYQEWRKKVINRDSSICQLCKVKTKKAHANHIKKFSDYPDLRLKETNGITLCADCHYGRVNCHEKEWESYFINNLRERGFLQA